MPGTYAADTSVPVSRSRDEIERILARFGATAFAYATSRDGQIMISFEVGVIRILMRMQLPQREAYALDTRGRRRTETAIEKDWEQACRQKWRTLTNGVKAKLALIDDGISTLEREFLADIVVPTTGQTYGEFAIPQIAEVYRNHENPPMIPGTAGGGKVIELPGRTGTR